MSDGPKIVQLPAKDEFAASSESLRRNLSNMIEYAALVATIKRSYYLSLVEQGFTEAQALELAKASILI